MSATYPPADHALRDLCLEVESGPGHRVRGEFAITDHLRGAGGTTSGGALAFAVDVLGGGLAAVAALPDWIATADLSLHLLPRRVDEVVAVGTVARRGRTTIVLEVDLAGGGAPLGLATMTFAVLPRRDTNPVMPGSTDEVTRTTLALEHSGFHAPFAESIGLAVAAPGTASIAITDYVRNSLGALQGGLLAGLLAGAAESALEVQLGGPVATVDLQISYLALARVGPVEARATVLDAGPDFASARVEAFDTGADDTRTTVARVRGVRV